MNTPSDNAGEIPKSYDPKLVEDHWWSFWEREQLFVADAKSSRPSFVIVIPPPNVTGSLHMGHMLVYTLHDIVVRWKRMSGFNTLWLPGTDHAGIATQNVVERQLAAEGKSRHDLGREAFEKRVWEWKERSGNTILRQLRRLGGSCDWTRERFTLDEGLSRAVREVFVRLYEEGLIYRGKRLINWCVRCRTALSDLEVKSELVQGKLSYIRYPIKGSSEFITVATTRPETMLGDTAVAVNPNDERYQHLVGKTVILPLLNREIPLIADEFVDPAFGTGLVKVTPAHDPNDFEMGVRHNLEMISVIDEDGRMTEAAGPFKGMDRFACRREVLNQLEALGLAGEGGWTILTTSGIATAARRLWSPHSPPNGLSRCNRWRSPPFRLWRTDVSASSRRIGRRRTSSGCATSATGASRASCGGVIAFRRGIASAAARST